MLYTELSSLILNELKSRCRAESEYLDSFRFS
jgi:hypothetical protein